METDFKYLNNSGKGLPLLSVTKVTACRFVDPKHWKDTGSQIGYVRKVLETELDCEVSVRSKVRQLKTNNNDGQMPV